MKIFYVGLIGYGKMGKIYEKEIKKIKGFKIVEILRKKKASVVQTSNLLLIAKISK